ncbi:MFS transporter, partial [Thermodesulfobacteriota bacterium]
WVHLAVFIVDVGYSKMFAASIVGMVGLLGSAGGIVCGFLSDHIGSKKGYTLGCVASFMGILFLISIKDCGSTWMVYTFAILHGIGNGGKVPVIGTLTGSLFPGNALGRIMAMQAMGFGTFGAIGAYVGGFFYDQMGTYMVPFSLLLAISLLGLFSIWLITPHSR